MKKVGIILVISFILIATSAAMYLNSLTQDNFIYPGISINGVDVSGLTVTQAKEVLQDRIKVGKVSFTHNEKKWNYDLKELGFEYDYDSSIDEAFKIGRSDNILENWITVLKLNNNKQINLELDRKSVV